MNKIELYNPFEKLDLVRNKCFLNGELIDKKTDEIYVFPEWLMNKEDLFDKPFKLLDESYSTYGSLTLPVSKEVKSKIISLNNKVEQFFNNADTEINDIEWFQWAGIIMYGLIYNEIRNGLKSDEYKEEGFKISPALIHKFKQLHFQLQSLIYEFEWDEPKPFSLLSFDINEDSSFEHRNEINTLTFSFKLNKKGLILCLQDIGLNKSYHKSTFDKIDRKVLHPIQFAEIEAKIYYSNYLLSQNPEFVFNIIRDKVYVTNVEGIHSGRSLFEKWDEKTFAQVLEAFWKPWKFSRIEIFKNAEKCISFLLDSDNNFISKPIV